MRIAINCVLVKSLHSCLEYYHIIVKSKTNIQYLTVTSEHEFYFNSVINIRYPTKNLIEH